MGNTSEEIEEALRVNKKSVARLANLNEGVANQIRSVGYRVETNPYVRAKISNENIINDEGVARGRVVDSNASSIQNDDQEIIIPRGRFDDSELDVSEGSHIVPIDIPVATNLRMLTSGQSYPLSRISYSPLVGNSGKIIPMNYRRMNYWRWTPYKNPRVLNAAPVRYLLPAPNGTQLTLFKKGGSMKKYQSGGSTVKGFQLPDIGHHLIDAARHINAYTGRKRQSELMEKSIQSADYNAVIPKYDQLSTTSGLGVLMQRGNIEKQALNNAYANVPKTSRYSDYLSLANSRAGKSLESERNLNIDINNLLTNNERTRLQQSNAYKSQVAKIIGDERQRKAAIQSELWQEKAGKEAGDIAQTEAGLEQIYRYYNQHKNLESAAKNINDKIGIQDWYDTEYNKIQQEILADMNASKLDSTKYYTDSRYTPFKNRLNDLSKLYQYKLAEVEIGNTMSPLTGSYFNINIPRPEMGQKTIPGRTIPIGKKGGSVNSRKNKTPEEMNHERILKNIELDNKRIIQLNENILKLLMSALK